MREGSQGTASRAPGSARAGIAAPRLRSPLQGHRPGIEPVLCPQARRGESPADKAGGRCQHNAAFRELAPVARCARLVGQALRFAPRPAGLRNRRYVLRPGAPAAWPLRRPAQPQARVLACATPAQREVRRLRRTVGQRSPRPPSVVAFARLQPCGLALSRSMRPRSRPPPPAGAPRVGRRNPNGAAGMQCKANPSPCTARPSVFLRRPSRVKAAPASLLHSAAPLTEASPIDDERAEAAKKKRLAFARPRGPKCASTEKFSLAWRCVFVSSPQAADASGKNALNYDGGASGFIIYSYVGGNPISYVDPTGEIAFVPILIGIGVGYAFDYALEQYKKAHCTCQDTPAGSAGNAAAGGAVGGAGPFASKPRGGIAGGGPSGTATSTFSQMNHAAASRGWHSVATRNGITKALRKIPYAGAALAAYELYDAFSCD